MCLSDDNFGRKLAGYNIHSHFVSCLCYLLLSPCMSGKQRRAFFCSRSQHSRCQNLPLSIWMEMKNIFAAIIWKYESCHYFFFVCSVMLFLSEFQYWGMSNSKDDMNRAIVLFSMYCDDRIVLCPHWLWQCSKLRDNVIPFCTVQLITVMLNLVTCVKVWAIDILYYNILSYSD